VGRKPKTTNLPVTKAEKKQDVDVKIYRCLSCGMETDSPTGKFYKSQSTTFSANDGYMHICISCLTKRFEEYKTRYGERYAMIFMCHYADAPFFYAAYDGIIQKNETFSVGMYLRQMNNNQFRGKTFINTILDKKELMIDENSFENVKENTRWKIFEHRNKNNTIDILGYDPFESYNEAQRKFLFNNIIGYLDEDGIEDDQYKLSQILQLVINNYQINQIDVALSRLDPMTQAVDMKVLQASKKNLVDANDKIAKENGISVKNRQNQQAGRSTLTYLMKYLRELDIPAAEANYYDQLKGEGTQWAATMSLKAIKENGFFDENDYKDIMENQYKMIQELQAKLDDVEEEKRLLLIENDELKEGGKRGK
jgi:hypothetical protein